MTSTMHVTQAVRGAVLGVLLASLAACTTPEGQGTTRGSIDALPCWQGAFDLEPDFFGTQPYKSSVMFRIQRSSDNANFSDGLALVVEDIEKVKSSLGVPLLVTLPPEVTPAGVPIKPEADPGNVHLSLYLLRTCKTQNVTLHAVREVSFDGVGPECDANANANANGELVDPACQSAPFSTAARGDGKSRIVFHSIFAGDTATLDSDPRRTRGCFDVYLAEPREVNATTLAPPRCRGHLRGTFDFLYRRSKPSQPFP